MSGLGNLLQSVNWDNLGRTASQVGAAAGAISEAANTLKKSKVQQNVTTASQSGGTDVLGTLLPIAIGFFLFRS